MDGGTGDPVFYKLCVAASFDDRFVTIVNMSVFAWYDYRYPAILDVYEFGAADESRNAERRRIFSSPSWRRYVSNVHSFVLSDYVFSVRKLRRADSERVRRR